MVTRRFAQEPSPDDHAAGSTGRLIDHDAIPRRKFPKGLKPCKVEKRQCLRKD
jgi:hypothetical protein